MTWDNTLNLNALQRRTDEISAAYLLLTVALVLPFRQHMPHWEIYVAGHLLASTAIIGLRFVPGKLPTTLQFLRDWYPVCGFALLYKEVEVFAAAFGNWVLSQPIFRLENKLFKGQPSIYLSQRFSWVSLSEYLHFCYFFYLLLIPTVGGYWYFTRRRTAFHELLFLVCLTYYMSFLFFMLFPVDSPFYLFAPPSEPISGHFFYNLAHFISGKGGARGGAFPSSHVAMAVVIWTLAWQRQRRLAYLLAPIILGLVIATVYCRFHYALDALGGMAVGSLIVGVYFRWDDPKVNEKRRTEGKSKE